MTVRYKRAWFESLQTFQKPLSYYQRIRVSIPLVTTKEGIRASRSTVVTTLPLTEGVDARMKAFVHDTSARSVPGPVAEAQLDGAVGKIIRFHWFLTCSPPRIGYMFQVLGGPEEFLRRFVIPIVGPL